MEKNKIKHFYILSVVENHLFEEQALDQELCMWNNEMEIRRIEMKG
jgi:hypothetical protein